MLESLYEVLVQNALLFATLCACVWCFVWVFSDLRSHVVYRKKWAFILSNKSHTFYFLFNDIFSFPCVCGCYLDFPHISNNGLEIVWLFNYPLSNNKILIFLSHMVIHSPSKTSNHPRTQKQPYGNTII